MTEIKVDKQVLYKIIRDAAQHGYNSYEEAEAGLKAFNAEVLADWIVKELERSSNHREK